jgi:pimeloyl-ACP methyl ester carboxylesterase
MNLQANGTLDLLLDEFSTLVAQGSRAFITFDFTGHGRSSHSADGFKYLTPMGYLTDLITVVDSLHLKSFIGVGHSLGAGVMLIFAATFPDRCAKSTADTIFLRLYCTNQNLNRIFPISLTIGSAILSR